MEGRSQGIKEGINQKNIEIAKNMLKKSMIEDIIEITGLSLNQINELK
jgi:predicted transposase/invertase (TIGR01784 family)